MKRTYNGLLFTSRPERATLEDWVDISVARVNLASSALARRKRRSKCMIIVLQQ